MTKDSSHNTLKISRNVLFLRNIFHNFNIFAIVIALSLIPIFSWAAPHIEVIALFENKAMLQIDNDRILVSVGETTQHGIKLIAADAHGAEIEIEDERRRYSLGNTLRNIPNTEDNETSSNQEILVYRGLDTLFRTVGSVNGYPVNFLVDTGASSIVISSQEAKRLGINYKLEGEPTRISTASGVENAVLFTIDRVTVSGVTLRSIEGIVIEGSQPSTPLLGMSFLNRFTISNDGNLMRLKRKY